MTRGSVYPRRIVFAPPVLLRVVVGAVGAHYRDFKQVTDATVVALLHLRVQSGEYE